MTLGICEEKEKTSWTLNKISSPLKNLQQECTLYYVNTEYFLLSLKNG